ncbi:autotransporter-associated beta strand repeat-containing protein [Niveibacterium terrae]|uniref:autotransporter-associated beta strand repeat-containing protein n=1 Tax=Niveibacterium terrae TaxID=3373598 RepID=UPI003A8FBA2A
MYQPFATRLAPLAAALLGAFVLSGCGSSDSDEALVIPDAPAGLGQSDTAPIANETSVPPFVDNASSNSRGDPCHSTLATNAGVRVLSGFLDIWAPSTQLVDAGVSVTGTTACPLTFSASTWTGIPGDASDGKILNASVHAANIQYVVDATTKRTAAQELAAYLDDRRGKGYSVSDGMGPLTSAWRAAAQQTTTITDIAADAPTKLYNDGGNNTGVGGSSNTLFGAVVDFVNSMGNNGSTEPAKRFYKYARPWRWSSSVVVVPALVPAKSSTAATDGGFTSGHSAEAMRDVLGMAYVMPERFQELVARGLELGENRILAGMHSPLDVISGRVQAQAVAAANIAAASAATRKAAYDQAHAALQAATGTSDATALNTYAHSATVSSDRFADHDANKANTLRRLTYGFTQIADKSKVAVVPKGAEVLLETRLPYLDANQRRVVLKSTALASGYPVLDDAEGWGRLNLFAAADGYGSFDGDVAVTMDASLGGFNALDAWRNDITGKGLLTKNGSGTLRLAGNNSWSGGTVVAGGTLEAASTTAFGNGDVYVKAGTVVSNASAGAVRIASRYTQLATGTLQLNIGSNGQGRLVVGNTATLAGGTLKVTFANGYKPVVGDTLAVLSASKRAGTFKTVTVDGYKATPIYTSTGVQIRIDG